MTIRQKQIYNDTQFNKTAIFVSQYGSEGGFIALSTDFPASASNGDTYMVDTGTTVIDNDPTKTNTGQTFVGPVVISWNTNTSKWERRDGKSEISCCPGMVTAMFLANEYGASYNTVYVLDASTYNLADGFSFNKNVIAPGAVFNLIAAAFISRTVKCKQMIFGTTGGLLCTSGSSYLDCDLCSYASTPPAGGYFIAISATMYVNCRNIILPSSSSQLTQAQSGIIHLMANKVMGMAYANGTGIVTVNTVDYSAMTKSMTNTATITFNSDITNDLKNTIPKLTQSLDQFYLDNTVVLASGTQNAIPLYSLTRSPSATSEQTVVASIAASTTDIIRVFIYNSPLNRYIMPDGFMVSELWASLGYVAPNAVCEIYPTVFFGKTNPGVTITVTGSGTTRTVTASSASFVSGDYNAGDFTLSSYIKTSTGFFRVIGYTSSTVITIQTLSTYTNQSSISFEKYYTSSSWKWNGGSIPSNALQSMISSPTSNITSTNNSLTQADKLAVVLYGKNNYSSAPASITVAYNGYTRPSSISIPKLQLLKTCMGSFNGPATVLLNINTKAIAASNNEYFNFNVPDDADTIIEVNIVWFSSSSISSGNITANTAYNVDAGAAANQYTDGTLHTYILVTSANILYRSPMMAVGYFANLAAGAVGTVRVINNTGVTINVIGIEVLYTTKS